MHSYYLNASTVHQGSVGKATNSIPIQGCSLNHTRSIRTLIGTTAHYSRHGRAVRIAQIHAALREAE